MPDFAGVQPLTESISFSEGHQAWHSNNNTWIGGTGKATRYPMFIKFVAGLRQQLDQQRLVQIFTSCRHHTIWISKNTALNHPEARKFEAFSRLEDMSNVKTIRMDWDTLIQMTKKCISYVYRFILYKYKSEKCVSICFCEAKLPSCTALSPYSAAAFLGMHSAHWHTEFWSESNHDFCGGSPNLLLAWIVGIAARISYTLPEPIAIILKPAQAEIVEIQNNPSSAEFLQLQEPSKNWV